MVLYLDQRGVGQEGSVIDHERASTVEYVGIGDVADALGVCPQTVRNLEAAGIVPQAARLGLRRLRVWPAADVNIIRECVATRRAAGRQQGDRASVA